MVREQPCSAESRTKSSQTQTDVAVCTTQVSFFHTPAGAIELLSALQ